jgi:hypothetical protein
LSAFIAVTEELQAYASLLLRWNDQTTLQNRQGELHAKFESCDRVHFLLGANIQYVLTFNMGVKRLEILAETAETTRQQQVKAELERILTSPGFRTSKRSQEFLRYIVDTALDGRYDDLKERVIGIEVFQRCPDYDTGEHSIVRVKANELRKRLAQFYAESDDPSSVQIHLPRGSYTPEFRWLEVDEQEAPQEVPVAILRKPAPAAGRVKFQIFVTGLTLVFLVVGCWYFFPGRRANRIEGMFWKPIFQDSNQPLICVADPEVLKLDTKYDALAFNGALPPYVPSSELVRDPDHYVGWGDALALSELSTFFVVHHKEPVIRTGNDVSFAELSKAPVILIGARSNPWTMQLANNLRFVFERTPTESYISDKTDSSRKWTFELGQPKVDYVVITRVFESRTGKMVVLAAGLSHYGTQAAGEILTNPEYLSKALQGAPGDWESKNMQLLFRVEVFGNTAGPPTLLASTYW